MTLAEKTARIRNRLLPSTLGHAVEHSAFYRRTLSPHHQAVRTVEELALLPIVEKHQLVDHRDELLANPAPGDIISFSSGSTTGTSFTVWRSPEELGEIQEVIAMVLAQQNKERDRLPLVLDITSTTRGIPGRPLTKSFLQLPSSLPDHLDTAAELLARIFDFEDTEPRITMLRCSLSRLRLLTLYFLQKGIDFGSFALEQIAVYGDYLTRHERAFLSTIWQATLVDAYSMSEFAGNTAVECQICGYHHFSLPTLVPEIVHPLTREPMTSGVGVLVLTSLYPFTQRQMFIRYWTGDVVEAGPPCVVDNFSFKVKGRLQRSVLAYEKDDVLPLLLDTDVLEALSAIPDLYRSHAAAQSRGIGYINPELVRLTLPPAVRAVLDNTKQGRYKARLEVGLDYLPDMYPRRVRELEEQVRHALYASNATLRTLVESQRATLEIQFIAPHEAPQIILRY